MFVCLAQQWFKGGKTFCSTFFVQLSCSKLPNKRADRNKRENWKYGGNCSHLLHEKLKIQMKKNPKLKFMFSKKATKLTKSSPWIWHYVVSVKSTVKILSIFVAFLENTNFKLACSIIREFRVHKNLHRISIKLTPKLCPSRNIYLR